MESAKAGMKGGTPQLKIEPLDPNRPLCNLPTSRGPCTRGPGHTGACYCPPQDQQEQPE